MLHKVVRTGTTGLAAAQRTSMNETNGNPEPKLRLPVEWQEERQFDVVVRFRPVPDQVPHAKTPFLARSDTTPPFPPA